MSLIVRHKNCVECWLDLGTHDNRNNGHWHDKYCIHGQPHGNETSIWRKVNQLHVIPWKVCNTIEDPHCETQRLYRMLARFWTHDNRK